MGKVKILAEIPYKNNKIRVLSNGRFEVTLLGNKYLFSMYNHAYRSIDRIVSVTQLIGETVLGYSDNQIIHTIIEKILIRSGSYLCLSSPVRIEFIDTLGNRIPGLGPFFIPSDKNIQKLHEYDQSRQLAKLYSRKADAIYKALLTERIDKYP